MVSTMSPIHYGSLPVWKSSSYSSGVISVTYSCSYITSPNAYIYYRNLVFYCSHAKECGSPPNYPCCPCSVPATAGFRYGIPASVDSAWTCLRTRVSDCLFCQHACGILNQFNTRYYVNPTDCQSSRCTSNPIFNSTDCGLAWYTMIQTQINHL